MSTSAFINPKDPPYNAAGDGVTDDTGPIRAVFAALSPSNARRVVLGGGTYRIDSASCAAADVVIEGPGTFTSSSTSDTAPVLTIAGERAVLRNLKIEATAGSGTRAGLQVTAAGAVLEDVEVTGMVGNGILVSAGRFRAISCYCHHTKYAGLNVIENVENIEILGGTYENNGGTVDGYGLAMHAANVRIVGVKAGGNSTIQIDAHAVTSNLVIANCTIRFNGAELANSTASGISVTGQNAGVSPSTRQIVIANNVIDLNGRTGMRAGILGFGAPGGPLSGDLLVIGNQVVNCAGAAAAIYIRPYDTKTVAVRGNQILDFTATYAVLVDPSGSVADKKLIPRVVSIVGNNFFNATTTLVTAGSLVEMVDNTWARSDGIAYTPYAFYATPDRVARIRREGNVALGTTAPRYSPQFAAAPQHYSWRVGDAVQNEAPAAEESIGWVCVSSGTFAPATSVTANATANSNVLTSVSDVTNALPGAFISLQGVTFGGVAVVEVVDVTSSTITVAAAADASAAGATLTYPAPAFKGFGKIES